VRFRRAIGSILLVAGPVFAAFGSASAGADCAGYTVSAPVLGTRSGTRCTPNLPPPFTQPFTDNQCGGVPLAKTTFCVTVTVYTP
jgi:hypothetical protein